MTLGPSPRSAVTTRFPGRNSDPMKHERLTNFFRLLHLSDNSALPIMKKTALRLSLILGLTAFSLPQLLANVIITSPTGGNNIPADKALNSTNGAAFTALGN